MTSALGDLDMDDVADDPWAIEPNTYRCVVTESSTQDKKDENDQIVRTWKWTSHIDEPDDARHHGKPIREMYTFFPMIPVKDQEAQDQQNLSRLKKRLREAFDFTKEELGKVTDDDLIGRTVYVTTVQNASKKEGDDRVFTNVRSAISERLFQERGGESSAASSATSESLGV